MKYGLSIWWHEPKQYQPTPITGDFLPEIKLLGAQYWDSFDRKTTEHLCLIIRDLNTGKPLFVYEDAHDCWDVVEGNDYVGS